MICLRFGQSSSAANVAIRSKMVVAVSPYGQKAKILDDNPIFSIQEVYVVSLVRDTLFESRLLR